MRGRKKGCQGCFFLTVATVNEDCTLIGLKATPGADFDHDRGNGYIRFSFAGTEADMAEAADRLAAWLG